jgi:hypothetical protein
MTLVTPEQFENGLKAMKPKIFMNKKKAENDLENNMHTAASLSIITV